MDTPIFDFVKKYSKSSVLRMHMPGHKGLGSLGVESLDITEIHGADSLYHADEIIRKSEKNASEIFGSDTYYSTEGASLCIRVMVYLMADFAIKNGKKPLIFAGRNAPKSFLNACAMSGVGVEWLYDDNDGYLGCRLDAKKVDLALSNASVRPVAVYITTPDYLGNMVDVKAIAEVCKKHGILLAVDNAHGGYLKFLEHSLHPMDLGADMCCDSAHKTLSALTGSAYLHLVKDFIQEKLVKSAFALFASTSPSYLTLASLDLLNKELAGDFPDKLRKFCQEVELVKKGLVDIGYSLLGDEPLKITIDCKSYGYNGLDFAKILRKNDIECEFSDPDFVVLMVSVSTGKEDLLKLIRALFSVCKKRKIEENPPLLNRPVKVMEIRDAVFSKKKIVNVNDALNRVLALDSVSCPPAVPIVVCGEKIDAQAVECFKYYGIDKCWVVD